MRLFDRLRRLFKLRALFDRLRARGQGEQPRVSYAAEPGRYRLFRARWTGCVAPVEHVMVVDRWGEQSRDYLVWLN